MGGKPTGCRFKPCYPRLDMRSWRNWETRSLEVAVVEIPCGFESHRPHQIRGNHGN